MSLQRYTRNYEEYHKEKNIDMELIKSKIDSKFVFISGGVISGVGKGVTTSFLGAIMKSCGYHVTAIKIDPYLNLDAGTFSPYEHGEVFVLDDGAEVDLDLGNYERMLDVCLAKENNITTGKIYNRVITKERMGEYLGKTVQIIPHITDEIQDWLCAVSKQPVDGSNELPDICLVEIGGIVGDIESMPFLEAVRQLQSRLTLKNYCHIHVSLVPKTLDGEPKTKPTQLSVRQMRSLGLFPDFLFCRCETDFDDSIKKKLSIFCDTPVSNIMCLPNMVDIFQIAPKLYQQNVVDLLCQRLHLSTAKSSLTIDNWINFANKSSNLTKTVKISIVGKYVTHKDAYHSISAAVSHAAIFHNYKCIINWVSSQHLTTHHKLLNEEEYTNAWKNVEESHGIIIPGGFDKRGIDGKISVAKYSRINKKPILGICLGLQVMLIEFAKHELGLIEASSTEFDAETPEPVIIEMPEFNPKQKGGTMRLGLRQTFIQCSDSHCARLYETNDYILERHRHRFEFNTKYKSVFEEKGMKFVAQDDTGNRMEIIELSEKDHPFYVGVQYHPEFLSRPLSPSPIFNGLLSSAIAYAKDHC